MVSSVPAPAIATNEWSPASWEAYARLADSPSYESARCYYEAGEMRIEMVALGPSHARDNAILSKVVSLFATLRMIRVAEFVNCTFRKEGLRDAQPDLAFYLGDLDSQNLLTHQEVRCSTRLCGFECAGLRGFFWASN